MSRPQNSFRSLLQPQKQPIRAPKSKNEPFTFLGPNVLFLGSMQGSKTLFRVHSCSQQLSFSMIPLILIFEFDLILGSFLSFWGPNGLFLGLGQGSTTVFWCTHVLEQLSFSKFLSILTFDVDLIFRSFLLFGALMGYFWGWSKDRKLFWGLLMQLKIFHFSCILKF